MNNSFKLTVEDVLKRDSFASANIIAGNDGVNRTIRWVHILEVTNIDQLLNGDELILTTGVGWQENYDLSLHILKQMIKKGVAGICIELGTYIQEVPEELIELANEHDFPIIVFRDIVRFIDITQELNGLLIDSHYKMMTKMEAISNQFNKLLLSSDGFNKILRLLHQSLDVQVVYIPQDGATSYYPPLHERNAEEVLEQIKQARPQSVTTPVTKSALKPVEAFGVTFGNLIIISNHQALSELDYLVLDRAATALSQDNLRMLYVEEKQKHEKNQWIHEWLTGNHNQSEVREYLLEQNKSMEINGCVVCLYETNHIESVADFTYDSMVFSSIFERNGFYPLVSFERNHLLYILINNREIADWRERMSTAIKQITQLDTKQHHEIKETQFGVSKLYDIEHVRKSYRQAKDTLYLNKKEVTATPFYEDLYIKRLLLQLKDSDFLEEYIQDYLKPVLNMEKSRDYELFQTLKILLEEHGSRKEAAERLFIVRQTLYHRIEKLKELLGPDFLEGEKRLALEFAIHAMEFLENISMTKR